MYYESLGFDSTFFVSLVPLLIIRYYSFSFLVFRQLEALVGAKNRYMSAKSTITEMGTKKEGNGQLSFSTKLRHDIFTSIHTPNLHSCIIRMIGFLEL